MLETAASESPQRRRPELSDVVGTGILGAVGLFAAVMGYGYQLTVENGRIGPGFLPTITGAFIFVAAVIEIGRLYLARPGTEEGRMMAAVGDVEADAKEQVGEHDRGVDTFGRTDKQRNRAPFYVFGTIGVALALVQLIGLLLALSLAMLFLLTVVERRRIVPAVIATVATAGFAYVVFALVLSVPLPTGLLGLV